jgi:hypothetical protein
MFVRNIGASAAEEALHQMGARTQMPFAAFHEFFAGEQR